MRELFTTYPTQLLGGGLLVLLGILVRFFPNLIAGYNTMSAEQKKNVDVKGLSRFMCLSLAAIGIGWIALGMLAGNLGTDYLNAIPKKSTALISVDMQQMASGKSDEQRIYRSA